MLVNCMPVYQVFCQSIDSCAGWGSASTKKNLKPKININSYENALSCLLEWRNLIQLAEHQKDGLSSKENVPSGCFETGIFFWEIEYSQKAEARLLESILLGLYVVYIYNPMITTRLYSHTMPDVV